MTSSQTVTSTAMQISSNFKIHGAMHGLTEVTGLFKKTGSEEDSLSKEGNRKSPDSLHKRQSVEL